MRHENTAVLKFDSVLALDLRNIFYTIKHYLVGISKLNIAYILSSDTMLCTLLVSNQTAIVLEQPKTFK